MNHKYLVLFSQKPNVPVSNTHPAVAALGQAVRSWTIFGLATLLVAAPQLPIYFAKAFGGRKVCWLLLCSHCDRVGPWST